MTSITQISNAALSSGSANVRSPSTPVARAPVKPSSTTADQPAPSDQAEGVNNQIPQPDRQEVQRAVEQANIQVAGLNETLSFGFVQELGQLVVQVSDKNTGEVIRQFPSREFIAQQLASKEFLGMLLNKQA